MWCIRNICIFSPISYTAVSVVEMDFERVDINQCPTGPGNDGPNKFANTARCKKETTEVMYTLKKICISLAVKLNKILNAIRL